jgi:glycosyltransferase involved in cell wall biosynthesis
MLQAPPPWMPTGFGQQIRQIIPRMVTDGHEVACVCIGGLRGGMIERDGVSYFPALDDHYGCDAVLHFAPRFRPDVIIYLQELWPLDPGFPPRLAERGLRWIPIVPIDSEPICAAVERLRNLSEVITYSRFGAQQLGQRGIHSTFIPHTVETGIFQPKDRRSAREHFGLPVDRFIFGMVAVNLGNPSRKGFQHVLWAFERFRRIHPNSALYLHTFYEAGKGFPIEAYAHSLGIDDAIIQIDDAEQLFHIGRDDMAELYAAFDCMLAPSMAEGFCVPIVEAMACGVPVIVTDFAAMSEHLSHGETGLLVQPMCRWLLPTGMRVVEADRESLLEQMLRIYGEDREAMGARGRRFVVEQYDADRVWERSWRPYLERLEQKGKP